MGTNRFARTLHDLGLAAWFGGGLMGVLAVNPAASELPPREGLRSANSAWGRWTPVNLAAIAAYLAGGAALTWGNKGRIAAQQGVGTATTIKAVLTGAALAATAYTRVLGQQLMEHEAGQDGDGGPAQAPHGAMDAGEMPPATSVPGGEPAGPEVAAPLTPTESTPPDIQEVQRRLAMAQWAVPALTGGLLVLDSWMGEQQRPTQWARGLVQRLLPG